MSFLWNPQWFDTKILGFSCAKIESIQQIDDIPRLIKDLKKNHIAYATYRIEANQSSLTQALEMSGFLLVDGIVALERQINEPFKKQKNILIAVKSDWEVLVKLAGEVFYANRFFNDPLISKEKANKIYEQWILNSLKKNVADQVLVYKEKQISGFVTLQKSGHIPLIGVTKNMRGKGIAKSLVMESLRMLRGWKVKNSYIETQISNIPAIRSYQYCGFKVANSYLTFRWSSM